MTKLLSVVETPAYLSKASKLLNEKERAAVVDMIAATPNLGVVMRGTGGLRKMRIPLMGRGKRGGGRIIYWFHSDGFPAVLLWVFAKNEAADLTNEQRIRLAAVANALVADFGGRR
jgi:RelE toxin of RelE / RelB toxin-antitoxin system